MNNFKWDKKYLYWGATALCVIIVCLAFFWIIQRWEGVRAVVTSVNTMLSPFIWGFIIAYLLTPLIKFLQLRITGPMGKRFFGKTEKKAASFGRGMAIAISVLLLLGIIVALVWLIIPQLYRSLDSIVSNISNSMSKAEKWANKWLDDYPQIEKLFTGIVGDLGETFTDWAKKTLLPQMKDVVSSVSLGVITVFKGLANAVIALVISVYVMYSREKFIAQGKKILYSVFPVKRVNKLLSALRFTNKSFMGFFAGKLFESLIIGIICYIGCVIIGLKDAVLISVIIGVTDIIPFFGPLIGTIPTAIIVLRYSPLQCLIYVIFIIVLQQFESNILGPRILGNATGLTGFWVMFALLVGAGLFGVVGMIIGVPLFAVIYAFIKSSVNGRLKKRGLPTETAKYDDLKCVDPNTQEPIYTWHTEAKTKVIEDEKED